MDKGYYVQAAWELATAEQVAIHNKNGQGLLLEEGLTLSDTFKSRNPQ